MTYLNGDALAPMHDLQQDRRDKYLRFGRFVCRHTQMNRQDLKSVPYLTGTVKTGAACESLVASAMRTDMRAWNTTKNCLLVLSAPSI